jgi:hypothetical protein
MAHQDNFFTPEDVDRQIDEVSQFKKGERADAEALAYLRSYYRTDRFQEQETLNRMWNRIAPALPQKEQNRIIMQNQFMQDQLTPGSMAGQRPPQRPRRASFMQRLGLLAAAVFLVILIGGLAFTFYATRSNGNGTGKPGNGGKPTAQPTTAQATFQVTSVDMAVTPESINGLTCGTQLTVTYTATFHVAPNSPGGTVKFYYTVNNGRGSTPASVTFAPGQTVQTYNFTWSGALPTDHTYPEPGGVQVTSPNALTSKLVGPAGSCTAAAFQVTSIDMAVSPTSIAGLACGTNVTVTYTATIHVAPGSPGGTVQFYYTVNNGRGSTPASVTFAPGQTVQTYSFTWSGALPADHTYPEPGGIQVYSPNAITSRLVGPTGTCQ